MTGPGDDAAALAAVALARSPGRLLAGPALLVAGGLLGIAAGLILAPLLGPLPAGIITVLGVLALTGGILAGIALLSVRLDVEIDGLRMSWWGGGERTYRLAPGPVTRITVHGDAATLLRPRLGAFGWTLGPARLNGVEPVEVVRLAPTPTLLVVPTERGRLAIATSDEGELVRNLAAAARIRQRYAELTIAAPSRVPLPIEAAEPQTADRRGERAGITSAVGAAPPERAAGTVPALASSEPEAGERPLTGIERARLEERLAAERAAAQAAAEAARRAAEESAAVEPPAPSRPFAPLGPRPVREAAARLPALAGPRRGVGMAWPRPGWLTTDMLVSAVPLLAAGAVWGMASLAGLWPLGGQGGLAAATLVLCGPGATAAGLLAARYWPPLTGLVVTTALCGLLLLGRGLI